MTKRQKQFLGIDLGASSAKYGYGNCQQGLLFFSSKPLKEKSLASLRQTFAQIIDEVNSALDPEKIAAVGIGTPGTIDRRSGRIVGVNPNLPFWVDHSPEELIPQQLKIPVAYDNDANLMCLGESWVSYPHHKVVGITVGSGIGCGLVDELKVFHGAHGFALELGHVIIKQGGALCNCGRQGCLEAYASVDGLKRRIAEVLSQKGFDPEPVPGWNLIQLLENEARHPEIAQLRLEGLQLLAQAIADLIVILDPDAVLIGGGATDAGLYDFNQLKDLVHLQLPAINSQNTLLAKAGQGNRAGVMGAIVLASQALERNLLQ